MQDFIDLPGASGATYRFRQWAPGASHLPMAGNYVLVQETSTGFKVLTVGASLDLSRLRLPTPPRAGRRARRLFTRLNVARAVRTAEHEDLAAKHRTAEVVAEHGSAAPPAS